MGLAIDMPVLVLNRLYQPCAVRPMRNALRKLCGTYDGTTTRKALVLDPATYETWTWEDWSKLKKAAPEIIVLSRYADLPTHRVPFSRRAIYKRDRFTCQYCGAQPGMEELSIDHVIPKSRGGISLWTNCVLACTACNARKANRMPAEVGMRLRHVPKRPEFMPVLTQMRFDSWEKFLGERYWSQELRP